MNRLYSSNRIILHIDFDSFFASCEQQLHSKFRHKPLGVTAANSRTCIIASSREAKELGIKTASSTWEANKKCPSIILVPAQFNKYWDISQQFIDICKDFSPYVEVFSMDELFLDVTKTVHLFGGTNVLIQKMKQRIAQEIGEYITVSVGVSHNKLLAKLGSGFNKPNGITVISTENLDEVYQKAELTDICGIGERLKRRLFTMGITTLLKLREVPLKYLVAEFGNVEGHTLHDIALGIDDSEVNPYTTVPEVKSVGRNYCLPHNEYSKRIVLQNFYELCEELAIKLRKMGKTARCVGFSMSGSFNIHFRKTYGESFDTGQAIYQHTLALMLYDPFIDEAQYVRQIRVWVGNLQNKNTSQLPLFYKPKEEKIWQTVDWINDKFGNHTIRNGFLLNAAKLTTVPNGYMGDKYLRIKLAQEVTY